VGEVLPHPPPPIVIVWETGKTGDTEMQW